MSVNGPTPNAVPSPRHKLIERVPEEAGHPHTDPMAPPQQYLVEPNQSSMGKNKVIPGRAREDDSETGDPVPTSSVPIKSSRAKHDTIQDILAHQCSTAEHPAAGIKAVGVRNSSEGGDPAAASSQRREWKRSFHMVIHLPNDDNAMRVTCLDTGADIDVISIHVVNSLGLAKEPYQGPALKPIGGSYTPQWQVKFDWHVAMFHKTYTSTFAVLDEQHSADFDVLLGRNSVEDINFYQINDKVWFSGTEGAAPPAPGSGAAQPVLPSIEVK
ncbi:MAG: hypothetical protein Q9169_005958 [Polycauliona sp. 2 TL-2023]